MKALIALYLAAAREFGRDRMAVIITILMPVALAGFFGLIFSDNQIVPRVNLGLAVADAGPSGQAVAAALTAAEAAEHLLVHTGEPARLLADLADGRVDVVLVLPAGFSADLGAGRPAAAELYYNPTRPAATGSGLAVVRHLIGLVNQNLLGVAPVIVLAEQAIAVEGVSQTHLYLAGMLAIALLWLGVFGTAPPLVQMREAQILRRIGVTPVRRQTLLAAQVAWRLTTGLGQAGLMVGFGALVFGLSIAGHPLALLGLVVLGALTMIALGFVLAALARTNEAVVALGQMVQLPMMFLAGVLFPLEMLPAFLRPIAYAMPLTYLSDALKQVVTGAPGLFTVWTDVAVLGGCLLLFSAVAVWRFRWD